MPTVSGYTTFGIIRKRMADIYLDFATRIKAGGAFGTQTTADLPDTFPTDPLVQIMTTTSASIHEVWEAVELWYSQLNPYTASGAYLEYLHGARVGLARADGQTDAEYRALILAKTPFTSRMTLDGVASAQGDIDCAVLLTSTPAAPIEGIPAPGNALVVKGCSVDYDALAQRLYETTELGLHQFYGNKTGSYKIPNGGCVSYAFMDAVPVFVGINVTGYYTDECGTPDTAVTSAQVAAMLAVAYASCGLGVSVNFAAVLPLVATIAGFVPTGITFVRRPKQLGGVGCLEEGAAIVTVCGVEQPWATSVNCGHGAGEVWCNDYTQCLTLNPWEYPLFDAQFVTTTVDETKGGCI